MWRKGNPLTLLVGMQAGIATLENSVQVPQKVENRATLWPSNCTTGYLPKDTNVVIQRGTCTPMFIAAMSTIGKQWKEPRCPSTDEWIKKMWCVPTMEYDPAIKKWNLAIGNDVDRTTGYYAKENKSITERQLSYDITHVELKKQNWGS